MGIGGVKLKKVFIVEVEYEELPENIENNADVFTKTSLECAIEDLMFDYSQHKSIIGRYDVKVKRL